MKKHVYSAERVSFIKDLFKLKQTTCLSCFEGYMIHNAYIYQRAWGRGRHWQLFSHFIIYHYFEIMILHIYLAHEDKQREDCCLQKVLQIKYKHTDQWHSCNVAIDYNIYKLNYHIHFDFDMFHIFIIFHDSPKLIILNAFLLQLNRLFMQCYNIWV